MGKNEYSEFYIDLWHPQEDSKDIQDKRRQVYVGIGKGINSINSFYNLEESSSLML